MILKLIILFVCLVGAVLIGEGVNRRLRKDNESSRKLVHVTHGVGLAVLAFIMPLYGVFIVEVVNLLGIVAARYIHTHYDKDYKWVHYFGRLYRVGRESYGDLFFPISAMLATVLTQTKWQFVAAILVLGLADAVAALAGKKYGQASSYRVFGQKKSLIGSLAFFVVTCVILYACVLLGGFSDELLVLPLIGVALALTLTENLGVYGSDNLLIPLVAVLLLNRY